jgi:hypothetical protein
MMEAGFGKCAGKQRVFQTLDEAAEWIRRYH